MVVTALLLVPMVPAIVSDGVNVTVAVILQATGNVGANEAPAKIVGPPTTPKLVAPRATAVKHRMVFRRVLTVPPRYPLAPTPGHTL
jgi:hypothetical protein